MNGHSKQEADRSEEKTTTHKSTPSTKPKPTHNPANYVLSSFQANRMGRLRPASAIFAVLVGYSYRSTNADQAQTIARSKARIRSMNRSIDWIGFGLCACCRGWADRSKGWRSIARSARCISEYASYLTESLNSTYTPPHDSDRAARMSGVPPPASSSPPQADEEAMADASGLASSTDAPTLSGSAGQHTTGPLPPSSSYWPPPPAHTLAPGACPACGNPVPEAPLPECRKCLATNLCSACSIFGGVDVECVRGGGRIRTLSVYAYRPSHPLIDRCIHPHKTCRK